MNKKFVIIFLVLFVVPFNVRAFCSEEQSIHITKLANNINTSVEYDEENKKFVVAFLNTLSEFMIVDSSTNKKYQADFELIIDDLKSGVHEFKIYDTNGCFLNEVTTKTVKIPYYNIYYNNKECDNFHNYTYCSKWLDNEITYDEWKLNVSKYKLPEEIEKSTEKDKKSDIETTSNFFILLYVEYYYIFLPIIIISFTVIIYLKNKSESIIYRKNKGEDITL